MTAIMSILKVWLASLAGIMIFIFFIWLSYQFMVRYLNPFRYMRYFKYKREYENKNISDIIKETKREFKNRTNSLIKK